MDAMLFRTKPKPALLPSVYRWHLRNGQYVADPEPPTRPVFDDEGRLVCPCCGHTENWVAPYWAPYINWVDVYKSDDGNGRLLAGELDFTEGDGGKSLDGSTDYAYVECRECEYRLETLDEALATL